MTDPFAIAVDPAERLLRVRITGLWTTDTVAAYRAAVAVAAAELYRVGIAREEINVLLDAREFSAQPQDVVAAYQQAFNGADLSVRKVATVTSNAIFRLQAKRIGVSEQRIFDDELLAVAWLRG